MLNTIESTIEKPAGELPLVEIPSKREVVEDALRTNPNRSDRQIAEACGVDHKTVGAARVRMGIPAFVGKRNKPSQSVTNRHGVTLDPAIFPERGAANRGKEIQPVRPGR